MNSMTNQTYNGGCLDLQDALQYLKEKTAAQSHEYEAQRDRVGHHLENCTTCFEKMRDFANKYNLGDDLSTMKF